MKKCRLVCIAILILASINVLYWGNRKQGMFLDEIYSYSFANFQKMSGMSLDSLIDRAIPQSFIREVLEVQEGERFDFKSVYNNIKLDRHPPLYYSLMHLVSSFFPNSHSKWIGISLNWVFYLLLLCLYFQLIYKLFCSLFISASTTCLFAISRIGVSCVIQIRMYAILTLFSVLLVYQLWNVFHNDNTKRSYLVIAITIWLGIMTQYIFVILASLMCVFFIVYFIYEKRYKDSIALVVSFLTGIILSIVTFPDIVPDLLTYHPDVSGASAFYRLLDITSWGKKLFSYTAWIGASMIWIALLAISLLIIIVNKMKSLQNNPFTINFILLVFIPAVITYFIICLISPWVAPRYVYYIVPIVLLVLPYSMHICVHFMNNRYECRLRYLTYCFIPLTLLSSFIFKPSWLYEQYDDNTTVLSSLSGNNSIFFFEYPHVVMASALHLLNVREVFLSENRLSSNAQIYIDSSETYNLVVFIQIKDDPNNNSENDILLKDICEKTQFNNPQFLFDIGEFSKVYLLSKR